MNASAWQIRTCGHVMEFQGRWAGLVRCIGAACESAGPAACVRYFLAGTADDRVSGPSEVEGPAGRVAGTAGWSYTECGSEWVAPRV